jgi:hypothetical protein
LLLLRACDEVLAIGWPKKYINKMFLKKEAAKGNLF